MKVTIEGLRNRLAFFDWCLKKHPEHSELINSTIKRTEERIEKLKYT